VNSGTRLVADAVLPCDGTGVVHRPGVVDIGPEGRIVHVGPVAEPARSTSDSAEWTVRWVGGLLLPGLVNAHCHSPMTLLRGQGEGLPLDRWLREVIWPREAKVGADDVYWAMSLAAAELLRYGVTTTVEMYFHDDALAAAVEAAGSRCVVTPGVVVAPGWERFGTWSERIEWIAGLRESYAGHPRI
jgi:5-methylthioadenosine/S-adenosylhomocysteine deaminase